MGHYIDYLFPIDVDNGFLVKVMSHYIDYLFPIDVDNGFLVKVMGHYIDYLSVNNQIMVLIRNL